MLSEWEVLVGNRNNFWLNGFKEYFFYKGEFN